MKKDVSDEEFNDQHNNLYKTAFCDISKITQEILVIKVNEDSTVKGNATTKVHTQKVRDHLKPVFTSFNRKFWGIRLKMNSHYTRLFHLKNGDLPCHNFNNLI